MTDDLRRVLKDPDHRLPDSLVDLDGVHRTARSRQRRRTSSAAVAGVFAVAVLATAVVRPALLDDPAPPDASASPTGSAVSSPSPEPSGSPAGIDGAVIGVTALSSDEWWVLETAQSPEELGGTAQSAHVTLLKTTDAGATFTAISRTTDRDGIPAGTTDVRFLGHGLGWALRANAAPGDQVWQTVDGGTTWGRPTFEQPVLALEAGGGRGWLLVQDGSRVGVAALDPGVFENPRSPVWLGTGGGAEPALTVQDGNALVFWFTDSAARLSVVPSSEVVEERANPCTPDVGVSSVSATAGGLAVSCHAGTSDQALGSADGGLTWAQLATFGDSGAQRLTVASTGASSAAIGGQDGLITLSEIPQGSPPTPIKPRHTEISGDPGAWTWLGFTDDSHGFAIDNGGALFRTDDGGSTWSVEDGTRT